MESEAKTLLAELNAHVEVDKFRYTNRHRLGYPERRPGDPPRDGSKFMAYWKYPHWTLDSADGPVELYWARARPDMRAYWGDDLDGFMRVDGRFFDVPWMQKKEIISWSPIIQEEKPKRWWVKLAQAIGRRTGRS